MVRKDSDLNVKMTTIKVRERSCAYWEVLTKALAILDAQLLFDSGKYFCENEKIDYRAVINYLQIA